MSIRIKLILVIIGVVVTVSLISGLFIYQQNTQKIEEYSNIEVIRALNNTSQLISLYFDRIESNLNNLANDSIIIGALETSDRAKLVLASDKLTVATEVISTLEGIGLHRVDGSTCVALTANKASLTVSSKDFSDRDYCQGITKTKDVYLSSVFTSAVTGNKLLGLVVPVKDDKGEMIGYVLGTIKVEDLRWYLGDLQEESSVILLDHYGAPFLDTADQNLELSNSSMATIDKIKKELIGGKSGGYFRDGDDFVGYKFNGSVTVIHKGSIQRLLAFGRSLDLTALLALAISIFLVISIIYLFIGTITKRISRLNGITQDIARGQRQIDLSEDDFKAGDEIADLAQSFSQMTEQLRKSQEDVEAKIQVRTKALAESEANAREALAEAEKANKLMIGRELEMVKLKEQINNLTKN